MLIKIRWIGTSINFPPHCSSYSKYHSPTENRHLCQRPHRKQMASHASLFVWQTVSGPGHLLQTQPGDGERELRMAWAGLEEDPQYGGRMTGRILEMVKDQLSGAGAGLELVSSRNLYHHLRLLRMESLWIP